MAIVRFFTLSKSAITQNFALIGFLLLGSLYSAPAPALEPKTVKSFDSLKLNYSVNKREFKWSKLDQEVNYENKYLALDAYVLQISLSKMSKKNFQKLKARYGNLSEVPYSPNQIYDLIDFLPPFIQAFDQKQFVPQFVSVNWPKIDEIDVDGSVEIDQLIEWIDNKSTITLSTNCWGTGNSLLRSIWKNSRELEFGWIGRGDASSRFSGEGFQKVKDKQIRFGDIMLVEYYNANLDDHVANHLAFIIEPELVFEKTDASENDAFRISYRADVLTKMRMIDSSSRVSYWRPNKYSPIISIAETDLLSHEDWDETYSRYLSQEEREKIVYGVEYTQFGKPYGVVTAYDKISILKDPVSNRYTIEEDSRLYPFFRSLNWK